MRAILLIGEDRPLLQIRAAVLSRFFDANMVCHKPVELAKDWPAEFFSLIVLCHSLSEDARHLIIAESRQNYSATKILQIESGIGYHESSGADAAVEAEPQKIVDRVTEMLAMLAQ